MVEFYLLESFLHGSSDDLLIWSVHQVSVVLDLVGDKVSLISSVSSLVLGNFQHFADVSEELTHLGIDEFSLRNDLLFSTSAHVELVSCSLKSVLHLVRIDTVFDTVVLKSHQILSVSSESEWLLKN